MELAKRHYRVSYQVRETDKPQLCNIKTTDLQELHRVLVSMTSYEMPVRDWFDLVVHDISFADTKEYGPIYLGMMYDGMYNFKSEMSTGTSFMFEGGDEVKPLFTKGLTRTARGVSLKTHESICFAPWMRLEET